MKEQEFYKYEIMCFFSNAKIKLEKKNQIDRINRQLKEIKNK